MAFSLLIQHGIIMPQDSNSGNTLQWRHNECDGVSNHQPHDCLLNRLFRRRSKETSKLRVTGLCVGNSPMTGKFPAQKASNAENVSIWWRHHEYIRVPTPAWQKHGMNNGDNSLWQMQRLRKYLHEDPFYVAREYIITVTTHELKSPP